MHESNKGSFVQKGKQRQLIERHAKKTAFVVTLENFSSSAGQIFLAVTAETSMTYT